MLDEKYLSSLYVFRVKSPTCGTEYIKIGKTTSDILTRHYGCAVGSPYVLKIHMTFKFKEKGMAAIVENKLHFGMKDFLIRGEWFIYNDKARERLLGLCVDIKDNHFDVRSEFLHLVRVVPYIDYAPNESPFSEKKVQVKRKNIKKNQKKET